MWRLTFNYVCEIRLGGGPKRKRFENNILQSSAVTLEGCNLNGCLNGAALNRIATLWPASNWMSRVKCWQRESREEKEKKEIDSKAEKEGKKRKKYNTNRPKNMWKMQHARLRNCGNCSSLALCQWLWEGILNRSYSGVLGITHCAFEIS